jgi:hypothetical protein
VLVAVAACSDAQPVRLAGHAGDTLVVNHHRPTRLAVRGLDARGRDVATHRARWRHLAGDPLALEPDGTVHCTQTADGEVEVVVGAARARLLVRCRPVTAFRASGIGSLRVQDDPVPFIVHPLGPDREPVLQIAGLAAVRDTSVVVVLRDAALHVRRRGATSVDVHVGNCRWQEPVEVLEPVTSPEALEPFQLFEDSLTLVPGEIRTWRLRGNLYWFDLLADSASEATLQFGTTGFNCARSGVRSLGLSCITRDSGRVVLRHTGWRDQPVRATVRLRVSPVTHPDSAAQRRRAALASAQRVRRDEPACTGVW